MCKEPSFDKRTWILHSSDGKEDETVFALQFGAVNTTEKLVPIYFFDDGKATHSLKQTYGFNSYNEPKLPDEKVYLNFDSLLVGQQKTYFFYIPENIDCQNALYLRWL